MPSVLDSHIHRRAMLLFAVHERPQMRMLHIRMQHSLLLSLKLLLLLLLLLLQLQLQLLKVTLALNGDIVLDMAASALAAAVKGCSEQQARHEQSAKH